MLCRDWSLNWRGQWIWALKEKFPVCDVIQETYLRAREGLPNFEYRDHPRLVAWLKTIAKNVIRNRIRKKDAQSLGELASILIESGVLRPSEVFRREEERDGLVAAFCKLPKQHQEILRLYYVESCSFENIASRLGKSSSSVRGLHRNAIAKLRRILKSPITNS